MPILPAAHYISWPLHQLPITTASTLSNLNFATTTSIQFLHEAETAAAVDHGAVHGGGQTALTTSQLGQDEEHFNINILLFVFPRLLKLNIIPSKRGQTTYRRAEESRDRGRTSSSSLVSVSTLSTLSRPHHGAVFMGAVLTAAGVITQVTI